MHDDERLLDSVQRLVEQTSGLSSEVVDMVLRLGERVVKTERALVESKRDRAELRAELTQTRYIAYVIVLIFVVAIAIQLWRG